MRRSPIAALMICTLVSGCGGSRQAVALPATSTSLGFRHATATETVIYSFKGGSSDGETPLAELLPKDGTFYGTTYAGGKHGLGTVFSLTHSGQEKVLHSFAGGRDGANPAGGLIDVNGLFYGTTSKGGAKNEGTIFTITRGGTESVLHNFGRSSDGSDPVATLLYARGTLLGTTPTGGAHNHGARFTVTSAGRDEMAYGFAGQPDGSEPRGSLCACVGTYGTTVYGGTYNRGTVFGCANCKSDDVLHSFTGTPDGQNPYGELVIAGQSGRLFGTTAKGGAHGGGTIFKIIRGSTSEEEVIHDFGSTGDGRFPHAGLLWISSMHTFYGTTEFGGAANDGIVFGSTLFGGYDVLYTFTGSPDGQYPVASLVEAGGSLYGTTKAGGAYGHGTVFSITP